MSSTKSATRDDLLPSDSDSESAASGKKRAAEAPAPKKAKKAKAAPTTAAAGAGVAPRPQTYSKKNLNALCKRIRRDMTATQATPAADAVELSDASDDDDDDDDAAIVAIASDMIPKSFHAKVGANWRIANASWYTDKNSGKRYFSGLTTIACCPSGCSGDHGGFVRFSLDWQTGILSWRCKHAAHAGEAFSAFLSRVKIPAHNLVAALRKLGGPPA